MTLPKRNTGRRKSRAQYQLPPDKLDWEYSPDQIQLIKHTISEYTSYGDFDDIIRRMTWGINNQVDDFSLHLVTYGDELNSLNDDIQHFSSTIDRLRAIHKRMDSDAYLFSAEARDFSLDFKKSNPSIIEIISTLVDNLEYAKLKIASRGIEIRNQRPLSTDMRSRVFVERVLKSADDEWRRLGNVPDFSKKYNDFMEAAAKPPLTCPRFTIYGAGWSSTMIRAHVQRLSRAAPRPEKNSK